MKKKIKILYIIPDLRKGGAERSLVDLCTELKRYEEIDFKIAVLFDCDQYSDYTSNFPIEIINYQTHSFRKKSENEDLKKLIHDYSPDIIHTHLFLAEFVSSYHINKKVKYVCHGHDNMHQFRNFSFKTLFCKKLLIEFLEKRHLIKRKYNHVDTYFIANSTHTKNYYEKVLPKNTAKNVRLIQYGFNFERFYFKPERNISGKNKIKILNVGSFQKKKNQALIIEIAKELKKKDLSFEINLLGYGSLYNEIEKSIKENNLEAEVILHGIIDNVEDYYQASDLYLHTAWYEPFGLVFLEAMASGLPIVTLNGLGNIDIIEDGKNGYLLNEQDPLAFAEKIEKLIQEPEHYINVSNYAKEYAKHFQAEKKVQELVNFYNSIIND